MSSQKRSFNTVALFLLKKWASTAFNNSEMLMVYFKIVSLSVS